MNIFLGLKHHSGGENTSSWSKEEIVKAFYTIRANGIPGLGQAKIIDVGSKEYLKYFIEEVVENYIAQGGSTCKFFIGDYGTGKTHIIDMLHSLALENNMAVARTELSRSLELEDWRLITKYILQNLEICLNGQTARSLPNVLSLMGRNGSFNFEQLDEITFPHNGFKKAMLYLAKGNLDYRAEETLEKYLLGNRLALSSLRNYGLTGVKEPLSKRNAESVFKTITTFLWKAGLKGTILLFDENEKTLVWTRGNNPPKRITEAANLMRRLVDSASNRGIEGVLIAYTVLPGFVERASEGYGALGQRLRIPNDGYAQPWRWPVIHNTSVNLYYDRTEFINEIAVHLNDLTRQCGVKTDITDELLEVGNEVLAQKAGEEYKRDLLKALTRICLAHIEGDE